VLGAVGDPFRQVLVGEREPKVLSHLAAEVGQRPSHVLLVARFARQAQTLLEPGASGVVASDQQGRADVVQGVDQDFGFPEPFRQGDRSLAPGHGFRHVAGKHAEL
jgi:hypothetical protein